MLFEAEPGHVGKRPPLRLPLKIFARGSRLPLAFWLCVCAASAQDARTLARKIDNHYNHLSTLQASFIEHYQGMGMDRTESGTLLMKKPGMMRWNYDAPSGKLFILNGKLAYSYTPGDAQAERTPASKLDDMRSPLRLLLGHAQLEKELANISISGTPQGFRLTGTPKYQQAGVQSLAVDASADGIIQSIRIEQSGEASTEFRFTDIHENLPLADAVFGFLPHAGVTIVDALAPM